MSARSTVWLRLPAAAHRRWWLGLLLCALALLATSTLSQPRVEAGSTDGYRLFNPSTDNTVTVQKGSTAAFVAYTFWLAPNDNTFTYIDITTPGAPAAVRHYDGFTEFVNCTPQCYTDGGIVGGTRLVYHRQFLSAGDYTLQIGYWPKEPLADLGHFYVAPAWHVHVPEDPIIANDHTPPVWNASLLMAPALSQYTASAWANNSVLASFRCVDEPGGSGLDGFSAAHPSRLVAFDSEGENLYASPNDDPGYSSAFCRDQAGNYAADVRAGPINIDKTLPQLFFTGFPVQAWGTQTSTGYANAYDELSGVRSIDCSETSGPGMTSRMVSAVNREITLNAPGTHVLSCTATDQAGNIAGPKTTTVTFGVDTTPPTITYQGPSPAPNAEGWNNTPVTLTWSCADTESGVVAATVSQTIRREGNEAAVGTCRDNAGNSVSDMRGSILIDLTPPISSATAGPASGSGVRVNLAATDGGSGVAHLSATDPTPKIEYRLDDGPWTVAAGPLFFGNPAAHRFQARATDRAGNVEAPSDLTPPVPAGLSVDTADPTVLTFNWTDGLGETSYVVAYSIDEGRTYQFFSRPVNAASLGLRVERGARVYVWVAACFFQSCSGWSDAVSGVMPGQTPAVPDGFRVTATTASSVSIAWNDAGGETAYQLVSSTDLHSYPLQTLAANSSSGTVTGLPANTTVYLWLRACAGSNCSDFAGALVAVTVTTPATPSNLRAGKATPSQVVLMWDDVSVESFYYLASSEDGGVTWRFTTLTKDSTEARFTGLTPGERVYATVAACNVSWEHCSAFADPLLLAADEGVAPAGATAAARPVNRGTANATPPARPVLSAAVAVAAPAPAAATNPRLPAAPLNIAQPATESVSRSASPVRPVPPPPSAVAAGRIEQPAARPTPRGAR